jgi:hypothetical protein
LATITTICLGRIVNNQCRAVLGGLLVGVYSWRLGSWESNPQIFGRFRYFFGRIGKTAVRISFIFLIRFD